LVIENHPHRTIADLRRKLVRRLAHTGSTFSGVGASGKPGAVHIDVVGGYRLFIFGVGPGCCRWVRASKPFVAL
ncbi:hypothetical protein, partial [Hephaestia mangrovi]|uniref:hypothetical protein n=1 Tax=Hephaestia mangrovi TaxID=2873268 RepID=UPI001CA7935C